MDRLIWETEYDFEGTEIMRRQKPRVLTPVDSGMRFGQDAFGRPAEIPQFLKDIMIEQTRLQPVKVKLESVIIKGSKILKQHPKSDYVEGTLLLMAKSYFYQSEWVSAEIKCVELIDRFALGDMSPDAHLLLSKIYLIQRKYILGKTMLSRTADIAWYKKRYDILSEAFRLMAEQAIFDNDEEEAVRPYRQAIAQSDDGEIRARWQLDLASLYYRLGKFDRALKIKKYKINVDSTFRDMDLYPNPWNYAFQLPFVIQNTKYIQLIASEIPYTSSTGFSYMYMTSKAIPNMIKTAQVNFIFARIQLNTSVTQTSTVFNGFSDQTITIFDTPKPALSAIDIQLYNPDGTFYTSEGENSFSLEFTTFVDVIKNSNISSRRGVPDKTNLEQNLIL